MEIFVLLAKRRQLRSFVFKIERFRLFQPAVCQSFCKAVVWRLCLFFREYFPEFCCVFYCAFFQMFCVFLRIYCFMFFRTIQFTAASSLL